MSLAASLRNKNRSCGIVDDSAVGRDAQLSIALEREIDLLREYRTRLVADVVTGKLDVREAAARLPEEVEEPEPLDEVEARPTRTKQTTSSKPWRRRPRRDDRHQRARPRGADLHGSMTGAPDDPVPPRRDRDRREPAAAYGDRLDLRRARGLRPRVLRRSRAALRPSCARRSRTSFEALAARRRTARRGASSSRASRARSASAA